MAAITKVLNPGSPSSGGLRPFDVRRDLSQVADLIERCFADALDPDSQHYLGQMRAAANNPGYLRWVNAAADRVSLPLSGYVWEEDGRVIGNLTLIPFNSQGRKFYLIANVAVHPDHRRHGIARSLTARAIEHAQRRNADSVWLHVREENEGAIQLYRSLGFRERARRSTWHSLSQAAVQAQPQGNTPAFTNGRPSVVKRPASHWPTQRTWLERLYPAELTWHLTLRLNTLQPGLIGALHRFFNEASLRQWSLLQNGRLAGVLAQQSTYAYADYLWLATSPEAEETAAYTLLRYAREQASRRPLALDYPAGRAVEAIQAAGFASHQTLIWMEMQFGPGEPALSK